MPFRFPTTAAELNARDQIAIVRPAKNCAWYIKALETCDMMHARERAGIIKEWKESKTWNEQFDTWAAACEHILGFTRRYADKMIASLSDETGTPVPVSGDKTTAAKSETLKRVAKLPVPNADEWEEKEHFTKSEPEEKPHIEAYQPPRDATGHVIPQTLVALRERRQEVTEAEHHASKLSALLEKVQNDGSDLLWRHLKETGSLQTWLHAVQTVRFNLAECLPDVVCPQCNGKGCQYCCGSGWISEVRWNRDYVKSHDSQKLAIVARRNGK